MADFYVDDNETIYVSHSGYQTTSSGTSDQISLGLADLGELSGQSTIFINKIRFEINGYVGAGTNETRGFMVAGVVRSDLVAGTNFDSYGDFQDVKGFPFKNSMKHFHALPQDVANGSDTCNVRLIHTFTPRKALLLNREQDIVLALKNTSGESITSYFTMVCQFKRGD